jgi:hypothetical protein
LSTSLCSRLHERTVGLKVEPDCSLFSARHRAFSLGLGLGVPYTRSYYTYRFMQAHLDRLASNMRVDAICSFLTRPASVFKKPKAGSKAVVHVSGHFQLVHPQLAPSCVLQRTAWAAKNSCSERSAMLASPRAPLLGGLLQTF